MMKMTSKSLCFVDEKRLFVLHRKKIFYSSLGLIFFFFFHPYVFGFGSISIPGSISHSSPIRHDENVNNIDEEKKEPSKIERPQWWWEKSCTTLDFEKNPNNELACHLKEVAFSTVILTTSIAASSITAGTTTLATGGMHEAAAVTSLGISFSSFARSLWNLVTSWAPTPNSPYQNQENIQKIILGAKLFLDEAPREEKKSFIDIFEQFYESYEREEDKRKNSSKSNKKSRRKYSKNKIAKLLTKSNQLLPKWYHESGSSGHGGDIKDIVELCAFNIESAYGRPREEKKSRLLSFEWFTPDKIIENLIKNREDKEKVDKKKKVRKGSKRKNEKNKDKDDIKRKLKKKKEMVKTKKRGVRKKRKSKTRRGQARLEKMDMPKIED